ncbi:MAG: carbamate kinase [Coriobacteriales bacterium]|jgi:carbamate kinase|nr:carbamate kinase [Coriobacteriales bacterium]
MALDKQKKRIVVALGGNALGNNLDEQMKAAKIAASAIADLIEAGHEVVLVHGNGPQVGMIETAFETASKADSSFPLLPMSVCVALSQGYIGYDLQNVVRRELDSRGISTPVATVVTQVEVDPADAAFANPTKPIGGFMTAEEAERLSAANVPVIEDSGRGYRRVVASPSPQGIVEAEVITCLLDAGQIPIAAGGGGIPVALVEGQYRGMSAVIDKDLTAAKLAEAIDADVLTILTAVEKVCINFGKPDEVQLGELGVEAAEGYLNDGQFGKGSMEPKVRAALSFVRSGEGREALITMLSKAKDGIEGKTGTRIVL